MPRPTPTITIQRTCLTLALLTAAACDDKVPSAAETSEATTAGEGQTSDDESPATDDEGTTDEGTTDDDEGTTGEPEPEPLLHPAAGDVLVASTTLPISWTPPPAVTHVDIWLSCDGADAAEIVLDLPNMGSYEWPIPFDLAGARGCSLVVEDASEQADPTAQVARADDLSIAALASFKWNGATEDYYWIDLATGSSKVVGTVGDLAWWPQRANAAFGSNDAQIYVTGWNELQGDGPFKLYTLAVTGELLSETVIDTGPSHPYLVKVNLAGELLALRVEEFPFAWELVGIDPDTGATTLAGTVGDMYGWGFDSALDLENDRLYVYGIAGNFLPGKIYTLDAGTGDLLGAQTTTGPASEFSLLGLTVSSAGELVGFRYDVDSLVEQLIVVDPETGATTVRGTVGDLQSWYGSTASNPTLDEVYVSGFDANQTPKLYVMSAATGDLLYERELADVPATILLVY